MPKLTTLSLLAAGAIALSPSPAQAGHRGGDEAVAALGGFVGGLIVGTLIQDAPRYDRTVVVAHRDTYRSDDCGGYWKPVTVRTWVPGYWTTRYDCGRRLRVYVPGYWEHRTERVWVATGDPGWTDRYGRHDRHNRHRGYGHDYRR